jgi:hypothetical protein
MKVDNLIKSTLYHNRILIFQITPFLIKFTITLALFSGISTYAYHNHPLNNTKCLAIFVIIMTWAGYLLASIFHSRTNEEIVKYNEKKRRIKNS